MVDAGHVPDVLDVVRDTEAAARAAQAERGPSLATITDLDGKG